MLWCALRILRAVGNRQFALLGKYYRWQFSGVNIAIVKSEHSYFFFVITIKAEAYTLYVACSHIFPCNVECYFVKLEFLFKQEGICDFKLAQSITVLMEWKQKCILGIIEGPLVLVMLALLGFCSLFSSWTRTDFAQDDNKGS